MLLRSLLEPDDGCIESSNSLAPSSCWTCTVPASNVINSLRLVQSASANIKSLLRPSIAKTFDVLLKAAERAEVDCGLNWSHAVSLGAGGMIASSLRSASMWLSAASARSSATSVAQSPAERVSSDCVVLLPVPLSNVSFSVASPAASTARSALSGRASMDSPWRQRSTRPLAMPSIKLTISTLSSRTMPSDFCWYTVNM